MDPRAWRRFRRNRGALLGAVLVAFVGSIALIGPFFAPADPDHQFAQGLEADGTPAPPGDRFVLGADTLGRDELSRLLYGGRASLLAALSATLIAVLIGLGIGVSAGYFGGRFDSAAMQLLDVMQSLPFLLIAITVNRVVSAPSIHVLVLLLGLLSWTTLARVTRAKTMQVRELEYVQAARALGLSEARILLRHVLPNVSGPAIVIGTSLVAQTILVESAMSFLGLGVPPPTSTWGTMLHDAQDMMSMAPRLVIHPGLLIVATVFGFNLLGEGLRDALDPKDAGEPKSSRAESAGAIAGLASLAALAALLAAFLPPMPAEPIAAGAGAPEDRPHRGGTFVFFHETDVRWFDPLRATDEVSNTGIKLLFEGLIEHDHDLRFVPRIARELPTISEDGLVYTFRLREGVRFHHGREVTAEDFRWSLEQMLLPSTGSPGAPLFNLVEGIEEYTAGRAPHVRGIRAIDRYTLEIRLSRPDQTFLHAMALPSAMPVPRELYEGREDEFARHPIGTGAFELELWEPGVRVTFRRNAHFFVPGQPYVDRMVFELSLHRGPAFMRFLAGQIDHLHRFTPTDYLWFFRQEAWEPYRVRHPLVDIWGLFLNNGMPPFDNRHVRRAVAFAIDRDRWNVQRAGRLLVTGQAIPPALAGHDPDLPEAQRYDLARAREEMALAGHPVRCTGEGDAQRCVAEGLEQEIDLWIGEGPTGTAYGVLAQQDLGAIGIRVRLHPAAFPLLLQQSSREGTVPLIFWGYSMDFPDTAGLIEPLFHSRGATATDATNRTFYRNAEVDRLFESARIERDPARRAGLYREINATIAADAPWAFIFSNLKVEAWQPWVRNYRPHPVWGEFYRDVWLDEPRRAFERARSRGAAAALAPPRCLVADCDREAAR